MQNPIILFKFDSKMMILLKSIIKKMFIALNYLLFCINIILSAKNNPLTSQNSSPIGVNSEHPLRKEIRFCANE